MQRCDIDSSILSLARWAAKNCPESLENQASEFLSFNDKIKDIVWVEREQFDRMVKFLDSLVLFRDNMQGISWTGKFKDVLDLYDLIYAGRINDDAPAGSP